jgi:hypothetical protein
MGPLDGMATGRTQLLLNINTTETHTTQGEWAEEVRRILMRYVDESEEWIALMKNAMPPKDSSSRKSGGGSGPGSPGAGGAGCGSPSSKKGPSYDHL